MNSNVRLAVDPPPRRPPLIATELSKQPENWQNPMGGARFTVFSRFRAATEKVAVSPVAGTAPVIVSVTAGSRKSGGASGPAVPTLSAVVLVGLWNTCLAGRTLPKTEGPAGAQVHDNLGGATRSSR